jgi:plastocyanin
MRFPWKRLGLPLLGAAFSAVLSFTPAFAQGAYPGGGYMSGSGSMPYKAPSSGYSSGSRSMPYRAPAQGGNSGYRNAPRYQPPRTGYDRDDQQYGTRVLYVIRRGDTLAGIARRFGVSITALRQANPFIVDPDVIFAGQTLVIPSGRAVAPYEGGAATGGAPMVAAPGGRYGSGAMAGGGYGAPKLVMPPPMAMPPMTMGNPQVPAAPPAAPPPAPMPAPGAQTVTVNLAARNLAFNMSTITVPAGAMVAVNFDNQDAGVPHNFAVYTDSSAQQAIFRGQIITGPSRMTYTFMAPSQPGTYFFRCDVHFTMMTGQFVVR